MAKNERKLYTAAKPSKAWAVLCIVIKNHVSACLACDATRRPGRRLPNLSFLLVGSAGRRCRGGILKFFPKIWLLPAAQVPVIPPVGGPLSPCASDALVGPGSAWSAETWSPTATWPLTSTNAPLQIPPMGVPLARVRAMPCSTRQDEIPPYGGPLSPCASDAVPRLAPRRNSII